MSALAVAQEAVADPFYLVLRWGTEAFPREPCHRLVSYWSPARTDVMRCVLKPSQCIRPT